MKFTTVMTVSALAMSVATSSMAENILRWTSQGDALTMDPHSQNEGPTIAMNGQIYESLVTPGCKSKFATRIGRVGLPVPTAGHLIFAEMLNFTMAPISQPKM